MKKKSHEKYMQTCIQLARIALKEGSPPVGAILVCNDKIIGEGIEATKSTGDITNHAEIVSIRNAIALGNQSLLHQSILYTTHEPCLMCSYVIRHYRIPHIVYGIAVGTLGGHTSSFKLLDTEDVPQWGQRPQIEAGICRNECADLNHQFQKKH